MQTVENPTASHERFGSPQQFLEHWQGHRRLTRKVIEAFPEKELQTFRIGGMRPFASMAAELLDIAGPGLKEIVTGNGKPFSEAHQPPANKEELLRLWDEATVEIDSWFPKISAGRFQEELVLFGQYPGTIRSHLNYFLDNEVHHRGQGYVYLRALGIEPPFFWER